MHATRTLNCYLLSHSALDLAAYRGLIESLLRHRVVGAGPLCVEEARAATQSDALAVIIADQCDAEARAALAALDAADVPVLVIAAPATASEAASWRGQPHDAYVSARDGVEQLRLALNELASRRAAVGDANTPPPRTGPRLSRREEELLRHLAEGLTLRAVAERMGVSYKTADSYRSNLMRKLGVHDRVSLVRWAIRHALVPV